MNVKKDWTLEQTDTPWAVSEAALAHVLGNATEQAYARSDLFDRRRTLMQQWGEYVAGEPRGEMAPQLVIVGSGHNETT